MEKQTIHIPNVPSELHRKLKMLALTKGIALQVLYLELIQRGLTSIEKDKT